MTFLGSLTTITITAMDSISNLSVSNAFNVLFKCTTSVNCSASN